MVAVVHRAIVLLHVWHQVVHQVQTEHIAAEVRCRNLRSIGHRRQQLVRIAVRQYDNHVLRLPLSNQIVQDVVHASHLIIYFLRIGGSTNQVEHRVFRFPVLPIGSRQIDQRMVRSTQALRVVAHILHTSVRHVSDVMNQSSLAVWNFQQTVLESFIRKIQLALWVHDAHTIYHKAIRIHVGSSRTERHAPHTSVGIAFHLLSSRKLNINQHLLCIVVLVLKRHRTIIVADGRWLLCKSLHRRTHQNTCNKHPDTSSK